MRSGRMVAGEQVAQVTNGDPFALPVWRSPVHRTPHGIIALVQLVRLLWWLLRVAGRHPVATAVFVAGLLVWVNLGPWALLALVLAVAAVLVAWSRYHRASFVRLVAGPTRSRWRGWWVYGRRWHAVMTTVGLVGEFRGRLVLPQVVKVTAAPAVDVLLVRLVSGQSPADVAAVVEGVAHGFRAHLARIRSARSGFVLVELVRRDALAVVIPALPVPTRVDLRALPVGRREDGATWAVCLAGTHLLVAGDTGAGKGSILWGLVRALLPAATAGLVKFYGIDPKLMELAYGRTIFDTHGAYAGDPAAAAELLDHLVAQMQDRARRLAGKQRDHTATVTDPFVVVFVDEVAFLTAYQPNRKCRERIMAALATLTTQGRAVGFCVVAALQDPRKEVMSIRNLFPTRIAMRLAEASQVDMVLGDGARDRGALADAIPHDVATGAGIGYVLTEGHPDPVRVRAGYVTDTDIHVMCASVAASPQADLPPLVGAAA